MEPYQLIIIVALLVALLGLILYLFTPREHPIDVIKDKNGAVLFKVYSRGTLFSVLDLTRKYSSKNVSLSFRSYSDVEAYISRRFNGW